MPSSKVSEKYAVSFYDNLAEAGKAAAGAEDMKLLHKAVAGHHQLRNVLKNPLIRAGKKQEILAEIFGEKVSKETVTFLLFLAARDRIDLIEEIAAEFIALRDEREGIAEVSVTSSVALSDEQKETVTKTFAGLLNKKIRLTVQTDEALIGGFVARVGDTIYDASLSHQLSKLKEQFINAGAALN